MITEEVELFFTDLNIFLLKILNNQSNNQKFASYVFSSITVWALSTLRLLQLLFYSSFGIRHSDSNYLVVMRL